jgi:hypothetical protein
MIVVAEAKVLSDERSENEACDCKQVKHELKVLESLEYSNNFVFRSISTIASYLHKSFSHHK